MTRDEVVYWINHHRNVFPRWGDWFDALPSNEETTRLIGIVLQEIPLITAKQASDKLFARGEQPRSNDRHAHAIAEIAKDILRELQKSRSGPHRCKTCNDEGIAHFFVGSIDYRPAPGKMSVREIALKQYGEVGLKRIMGLNCHCSASKPNPSGIPEWMYERFVPMVGPCYFRNADGSILMVDEKPSIRNWLFLSDEERDVVLNGPGIPEPSWQTSATGAPMDF